MLRLLIDGDALVWKFTEANQEETWWPGSYGPVGTRTAACNIGAAATDITIEANRLADLAGADFVTIVLGPWENQNFRRLLWPEYKTHRRRCDTPVGMHMVRKAVVDEWQDQCIVALPHEEADDVIGHWMTDPKAEHRMLWSPDKDMMQIPGWHLDGETGEKTMQLVHEADWYHMYQTLIGDTSDGYPGCKGVGPVKAKDILDPKSRESWWPSVRKAFGAAGFNEKFALNQARVARILRYNEAPGEWLPTTV